MFKRTNKEKTKEENAEIKQVNMLLNKRTVKKQLTNRETKK